MGTDGTEMNLFDAFQNTATVVAARTSRAGKMIATGGAIVDSHGWRWGGGTFSFFLFNRIQNPNGGQYIVNYCRLICSPGCNMDNSKVSRLQEVL